LGGLVDLGNADHPPAAVGVDLNVVCAHHGSGCDSAPMAKVPTLFP
jgi:hypothetical protein